MHEEYLFLVEINNTNKLILTYILITISYVFLVSTFFLSLGSETFRIIA